MGGFDLLVVVLYLGVTVAAGMWLGRGGTDSGFLVAGRSLAWPALMLSIVATETSTVTFLSLPGKSFVDGGNFGYLQLAIGYIFGRLIVAWWLLPEYFRGELFTAHEVLERRFGPRVRRAASLLFLGFRNLADGLRLMLTAFVIQEATGWGFSTSVLVLAGATAAYAAVGGVASVIWNDCAQFVVYMLGAIVTLIILAGRLPGGAEQMLDFAHSTQRDRWFLSGLGLHRGSITFWSGLIGGAVLSLASHGVDHLMVQRYLCAKNEKQARIALVISGPVIFVQFAIFLAIGVALAAWHTTTGRAIADTPGDKAFLEFIAGSLPPGVTGLLVAAVLAAAMSTLSSSFNASAGVAVKDLIEPLWQPLSPQEGLRWARMATVLMAVIQAGVAILADQSGYDRAVIDSVLEIAGMATGLLVGLFALGTLRGAAPESAGLAALAAGFAACVAIRFTTDTNWPWFPLIGASVTLTVGWLVAMSRAKSQAM